MNLYVLFIAWAFVLAQAVCAHVDSFLTRSQMRSRPSDPFGPPAENGWSFMEHGGMWADFLIISPVLAYVMGRYEFHYFSFGSLVVLFASAMLVGVLTRQYCLNGQLMPEAHAHWGEITHAGRIHTIFFVAGLSILAQFYLLPLSPKISPDDLKIVSLALTPFFFMGVAKWNRRWFASFRNDTAAIAQTIMGPAVVWACALVRIRYNW